MVSIVTSLGNFVKKKNKMTGNSRPDPYDLLKKHGLEKEILRNPLKP
jgi:hypothetical protein